MSHEVLQPPQGALQRVLLENYMTTEELAVELGNSPRTINRWHVRRIGPPRICIGRMVLYRRDAVREWLASLERRSQREAK